MANAIITLSEKSVDRLRPCVSLFLGRLFAFQLRGARGVEFGRRNVLQARTHGASPLFLGGLFAFQLLSGCRRIAFRRTERAPGPRPLGL